MDIKVGDIVNISGRKQRITHMSQHYLTLSYMGTLGLDAFEHYANSPQCVIEPITLPQLNIGDLVFVRDITNDEKSRYCLTWWTRKNKYIGRIWPVTYIRHAEFDGQIVTLGDGEEFHVYHLEKIKDYDMF